ncbi:hypothetical protein BZG36_04283 [Bifiguratus adelaidae]|uniref:BHLH domain-containing protein n=1 Tax=Bifiguratus adelaidae TaxID=1938954 RepID=A0A261XW85_9FUNG|nr:hypothetical protein BZG36_04283 [Bifiguratus adelaidae]
MSRLNYPLMLDPQSTARQIPHQRPEYLTRLTDTTDGDYSDPAHTMLSPSSNSTNEYDDMDTQGNAKYPVQQTHQFFDMGDTGMTDQGGLYGQRQGFDQPVQQHPFSFGFNGSSAMPHGIIAASAPATTGFMHQIPINNGYQNTGFQPSSKSHTRTQSQTSITSPTEMGVARNIPYHQPSASSPLASGSPLSPGLRSPYGEMQRRGSGLRFTNNPGEEMQMLDNVSMGEGYDDEYSTQVNLQAVMEKRRKRRESHNAVERRRRDNINEKIQELGELLPPDTSPNIDPKKPIASSPLSSTLSTSMAKANKGAILRRSVDHIKFLQQEVITYQSRVRELERLLEGFRGTAVDSKGRHGS